MQFITLQFFVFFTIVFAFAVMLKDDVRRFRPFLLAASLSFYLFFGVNAFALFVANIVVNYFLVRRAASAGRAFMTLAIVANVLYLGVFKYYNFGTDALLQTLNLLGVPADIRVIRIMIPVGISFYTFRVISHLVDTHRGDVEAPSFVDYANYVAFFPQIMSGPIVRAPDFYRYLHEPGLFSYSNGRILTLLASGLFKKYVLASFLYDAATQPFGAPSNYSSVDLFAGMLAYAAMIFVDFSGYSDLAIAFSNLLGFHVHRNFHSPYGAIGLKDFWNRWHISLSAWLRDYVYIPLGGSRKGTARKYLNILVTMFVSGLWHGAGLTFVVWGLLHGIGSVVSHILADYADRRRAAATAAADAIGSVEEGDIDFYADSSNKSAAGLFVELSPEELGAEIEKLFDNLGAKPVAEEPSVRSPLGLARDALGWLATFLYVSLAWVFFTAPSVGNALAFIGSMFTSPIRENRIVSVRLALVVGLVLVFNFVGNRAFRASIGFFDRLPFAVRVPVFAAAAYVILRLGPETMPPFIYFSF